MPERRTVLARPKAREGFVKWTPWALLLTIGIVAPLLATNSFQQGVLFYLFLWGALATGWNIIGGYAGQLSLGHGAAYGIGAYVTVLLAQKLGLSPWIGMLAGALLASFVGAFLGIIAFRLKGPFFALATLAFGQIMMILAVNWRSLTNGNEGLVVPLRSGFGWLGFENKIYYTYLALGFLLISLVISHIIKYSRLGYFLAAYREDDAAAQAAGVNTYRARIVASAISFGITAIGGTLYAYHVLFVEPASVMDTMVSIQMPLLAVVGGVNTVFGPMLGAAVIHPLSELLRASLGGEWIGSHWVVYGALLIVVILHMPGGLLGLFQGLTQRRRGVAEASKGVDAG